MMMTDFRLDILKKKREQCFKTTFNCTGNRYAKYTDPVQSNPQFEVATSNGTGSKGMLSKVYKI
jgi:hypothetical protein